MSSFPDGYFADELELAACKACEPGKFLNPSADSLVCQLCTTGKFASGSGSASCLPMQYASSSCPEQLVPVEPSALQDGCRPCTSQESYAQLSGCGRGQELQTVGFGLAIAFAIVLAIPVGLFWRRNPKYPLVFVLTIYFTLLDVITDILYVSIEPFSSPELLTAAIIFVGFAPLSLSTLFYY